MADSKQRSETDPLAERVGKAVLRERERRGWTQTDLAERAGMTFQAVSKVELGGFPRADTLRKIREALDVSYSALFDEDASGSLGLAEWISRLPDRDRHLLAEFAERMGRDPPADLLTATPPRPGAAPAPPTSPPVQEAAPQPRRESMRMRKAG